MTTLRAAMVVGKGSAAFETILGLVKRLPVMITPSWVSTPTQPIALDDIARYLAGVAATRPPSARASTPAGPEVMTYRQMIERIARLLGRRPRIVEVPVLTPRSRRSGSSSSRRSTPSVARPLVEGLRNPTVAREERIRELLPFELTPFDEAARQALAAGHAAVSADPSPRRRAARGSGRRSARARASGTSTCTVSTSRLVEVRPLDVLDHDLVAGRAASSAQNSSYSSTWKYSSASRRYSRELLLVGEVLAVADLEVVAACLVDPHPPAGRRAERRPADERLHRPREVVVQARQRDVGRGVRVVDREATPSLTIVSHELNSQRKNAFTSRLIVTTSSPVSGVRKSWATW